MLAFLEPPLHLRFPLLGFLDTAFTFPASAMLKPASPTEPSSAVPWSHENDKSHQFPPTTKSSHEEASHEPLNREFQTRACHVKSNWGYSIRTCTFPLTVEELSDSDRKTLPILAF